MPAKITESRISRALCSGLDRAGAFTQSIVGSTMNQSGRPDRWIACQYWHGWFEAKLKDAKLRADQKIWIWQCTRRQPGSVLIFRYFPPMIIVSAVYALGGFELQERKLWQFQLWPLCHGKDKPGNTPEWSKEHCDNFFQYLNAARESCLTPPWLE